LPEIKQCVSCGRNALFSNYSWVQSEFLCKLCLEKKQKDSLDRQPTIKNKLFKTPKIFLALISNANEREAFYSFNWLKNIFIISCLGVSISLIYFNTRDSNKNFNTLNHDAIFHDQN